MEAKSVIPLKRRAFDQWKIANPWLRLVAQGIDQALIGFLTGSALQLLFPEKAWTFNWWLTWLLFWPFISISGHSLCLALMGTTPGKRALGLRVVSTHPGKPLSHWQILQRTTSWWIGLFSMGASWSTILSRSDRRAWHDIVAETVVLHDSQPSSPVKNFEKSIGVSWGIVASVLLIVTLSMLFVVQVKRLANQNITAVPHNLEALSWALLSGSLPEVKDQGLPETEQKLLRLLGHFGSARLLPEVNRFDYYKTHMQADEDYLCRAGQEGSQPCQSAQLIAELLTHATGTSHKAGALPVLRVIQRLGEFANVNEEIEYLAEQSKKALLHSAQYLALKTAQAKLLSKKGDFQTATSLLNQDLIHIPESSLGKIEKVVYGHLTTAACEAQALAVCQIDNASCTSIPYWKEWTVGCQEKRAPAADTSSSYKLSFWWKKVNDPESKISLKDWIQTSKNLESTKLTTFERHVFLALDFVISVKSEDPQDIKDKANRIAMDNPLWAWAQQAALQQYGSQWSALLKKSEATQLAYLVPTKLPEGRMVASTKSKKSKKKSAKSGSRGTASRR
ncbi:MAG: RDD family protein [Oligoflexia bacterium]|nr:RDD family protein [Oligoflexia bacterium]